MLKIGVLVSGGGTNLQAILDKIESGYLKGCAITAVISSKPNAYALERAASHQIPVACISRKSFDTLDAYDTAMIDFFSQHEVALVVMAGFLSMVGQRFVDAYKNCIINIHPSLIPSFCGKGYYGIVPHQKALAYGVKVTGATVHFVDTEYDSGPVILQKAVEILDHDTPEILQQRVMEQAEWEILPQAIRLYLDHKLKVDGRKVTIC